MVKLKNHALCGGATNIRAASGGQGTGETTSYAVNCVNCGEVVDVLPLNCSGKRRDAIADWNRMQKSPNVKVTGESAWTDGLAAAPP